MRGALACRMTPKLAARNARYKKHSDEFSGSAAAQRYARQKPAITRRADVLELPLAYLA
jgi:hypothetical protein